MGSTSGALISHLQFNLNNHSCFDRFESIRTHLNCVQAHHSRRPKLRLQSRKSTRSVICFAVDDDLRERQEDLGGVGSAVEDRPDKVVLFKTFRSSAQICANKHSLVVSRIKQPRIFFYVGASLQ